MAGELLPARFLLRSQLWFRWTGKCFKTATSHMQNVVHNQKMKTIHYYIDESGGVSTDSSFFILGCFKTDTPMEIQLSISSLKEKLMDDPYFAFEREKIQEHGFHATANHWDVRARFFGLISTLNIRAYILLLNKKSEYFDSLISDGLTSEQIYNRCIKKLLTDRLTKTRHDNNVVIFEQYGNKPNNWLENVESVVNEIRLEIKNSFNVELKCSVEVHDKSDINLSVIDYINFVFTQFYEQKKFELRMQQNFQIIEPKIGLIYKLDQDIFYHKNNRLNVKEY